ncbi:MAG: CBS domain-containing protein [Cyanobacteria bacterium P01_D01_bin.14]
MDLVLCHTVADFDTLGAAVGVTQLQPGSRIVLTGDCHPDVQAFLALHRDEYALLEHRAVDPSQIRSLTLVDAHERSRVGLAAAWIDQAEQQGIPITIYDHHTTAETDIASATVHNEPVGATTTLIVEALRSQSIDLAPTAATVMALGIHADTGSLRYEQAVERDALALAWLMAQGADQTLIAQAAEATLSADLLQLLQTALNQIHVETTDGYQLGWLKLEADGYVPGLSGLASQLVSLLSLDALLLGTIYPGNKDQLRLTLIGRARTRPLWAAKDTPGPDFGQLFADFGGGGHPQAAAAVVKSEATTREAATDLTAAFDAVLARLRQQIPRAQTTRQLMSSPVRTVRPDLTIGDAQRVLLRYGHAGLCVVDADDQLVGMISRRDIDLALHHGYGHAPVKGFMTSQVKTVTPETPVTKLHKLMVDYDIGRLPVLDQAVLVGIVTRSDLLRQIQSDYPEQAALVPAVNTVATTPAVPSPDQLYQRLQQGLPPALWTALTHMAGAAAQRGWQLYVVGGAVRDLLLSPTTGLLQLQDIDLVVDGAQTLPETGAGIALAEMIQQQDPQVEVQIHGQFQTAALVWPKGTELGPLMVDIATARTEFYAYPAANPEVEASSIRQDLYRRDFTINAMAIALTPPQAGQLLDFFGGWVDLQQQHIRVLHANSFIEDPTRIFRAVRFATRLDFEIDSQTEQFIRYAVASGIYRDLQQSGLPHRRLPALQTRLKTELKYLLESAQWAVALQQLERLGALSCVHPDLSLTPELMAQLQRLGRWHQRFASDFAQRTPRWQLLLEGVLTDLHESGAVVAQRLELPTESQERLGQLTAVESQLLATLPNIHQPSGLRAALNPHSPLLLWLIAVRHPRVLGTQIWRYLLRLRTVSSPLDGHDLKQLGYSPGPEFKQMLTTLTAAALDGQVTDRASAVCFIKQRYPRNNA